MDTPGRHSGGARPSPFPGETCTTRDRIGTVTAARGSGPALVYHFAMLGPAPGPREFPVLGKRIKIETANLEPGMFVAQLDRPWLETPFIVHGFCIQDDQEIRRLRQFCRHVYVDPERSAVPREKVLGARNAEARYASSLAASPLRGRVRDGAARPWTKRLLVSLARLRAGASGVTPSAEAHHAVPVREEAPRAAVAYDAASNIMTEVFELVRQGRRLDVGPVRDAAGPLVDSMERNENAMAWLVFLRKRAVRSWQYSVAGAVWAVMLGRHLGLERHRLENLAVGGMLLDIGEARIPPSVLFREDTLDAIDQRIVQKHVEAGLSMVRSTPGVNADMLAMIEYHHERHDGSGYPKGVAGDAIPVLGRVAGIVDCFDAMTTPRPYAPARSPYDAVRELNSLAGVHFQRELVERFVEALGMFPTGSLVELSTGQVGVVVEQNLLRRLRPKVQVLLEADGSPAQGSPVVDLGLLPGDARQPGAVWIDRGLEPGDHGLDPGDCFT
jgi:HD-GYP domain-containing protein (c-di-GMP phosphodiesterase class II)